MNHYETLGVNEDATRDEIKKAYREQANKHHPDKPGGDQERMKAIVHAKAVLLNPEQRSYYDKYGEDKPNGEVDSREALLAQVFNHLIDSEFQGDIKEEARAMFENQIITGEQSVMAAEQAVRRLTKQLGRMVVNEGENNVYENILNSRIQKIQDSIDQAKKDIAKITEAMELLDIYSDTSPDEKGGLNQMGTLNTQRFYPPKF